jgi:hypothetical protein
MYPKAICTKRRFDNPPATQTPENELLKAAGNNWNHRSFCICSFLPEQKATRQGRLTVTNGKNVVN